MVMKTISVFSGVQMVGILCSIVRTKFVAIWIGTVGVGLFGLFNTSLDMLKSLTDMGLRTSVVPSIARANSLGALQRISYIVRRWMWCLGALGGFLTLLFSPLLSLFTFGDYSHTLGFILLAASVFFSSVVSSEQAVLQGTGKVFRIARASLWGSIIGVVLSVPLFYFFRVRSIVPTILLYSFVTAAAMWLSRNKVGRPEAIPTARETFREGSGFVKVGIYMASSIFITTGVVFVFMVWLNYRTNTSITGLYQTGYTLTSRYIGVIFTALVLEYYPRLCRVRHSRARTSAFVNHESQLVMLIVLPIVTMFMALDDVVIRLLYSSEFEPVKGYLALSLTGTAFQAVSFCMAYVILAREDGRVFMVTEIASSLFYLGVAIGGYELWGFDGLGVAYMLKFANYLGMMWYVYSRRYGLRFSAATARLLLVVTLVSFACAILRLLDYRWPVLTIGILCCAASIITLRRMLKSRS